MRLMSMRQLREGEGEALKKKLHYKKCPHEYLGYGLGEVKGSGLKLYKDTHLNKCSNHTRTLQGMPNGSL